jgi:hypothetical protein
MSAVSASAQHTHTFSNELSTLVDLLTEQMIPADGENVKEVKERLAGYKKFTNDENGLIKFDWAVKRIATTYMRFATFEIQDREGRVSWFQENRYFLTSRNTKIDTLIDKSSLVYKTRIRLLFAIRQICFVFKDVKAQNLRFRELQDYLPKSPRENETGLSQVLIDHITDKDIKKCLANENALMKKTSD